MVTQKFTNFDKVFLMHVDVTAVTIQSNKIVSNEVKALPEPPYRKKPTFWPTQWLWCHVISQLTLHKYLQVTFFYPFSHHPQKFQSCINPTIYIFHASSQRIEQYWQKSHMQVVGFTVSIWTSAPSVQTTTQSYVSLISSQTFPYFILFLKSPQPILLAQISAGNFISYFSEKTKAI